jgi:hypothetical protein
MGRGAWYNPTFCHLSWVEKASYLLLDGWGVFVSMPKVLNRSKPECALFVWGSVGFVLDSGKSICGCVKAVWSIVRRRDSSLWEGVSSKEGSLLTN